MAYFVPQMPLLAYIWHPGHTPGDDPPDVITPANLAWGKRVNTEVYKGDNFVYQPGAVSQLLVPALTDIRGENAVGGRDIVEVPATTGRFYVVLQVEDLGKGFPNEHRLALIQQGPNWPVPIP